MSSAWDLKDSFYDVEEEWIDLEFGKHLGDWRNNSGLTLGLAAKMIGISSSRLESLEEGFACKGVTETELYTIADIYNIDIEEVRRIALGEGDDFE